MIDFILPSALTKKGFSDCRTAVIYSMAFNMGKNAESLPALYFGFQFKDRVNDEMLHELLEPDGLYFSNPESAESLCGLKFTETSYDKINLTNYFENNKAPVILVTDTYYCPWNMGYKKVHAEHDLIALGYDGGFLVVQDTFEGKKEMKAIIQELNPKSIIFAQNTHKNQALDAEGKLNLMKEALSFYLENHTDEKIKKFADMLNKPDELKKTMQGYEIPLLSPLFIKLRSLLISRLEFTVFLKSCISSAPETVKAFYNVGRLWKDSYHVLLRSTLKTEHEDISEACGIFYKTAKAEAEAVGRLYSSI